MTKKLKFYSQYKQDEWLYNNFFKDKENGVFLEIGADDGIDKSNTLFFEEQLGWKGMCIEPSPERFNMLKNNRKCICENYALSDEIKEVDFLDISGWGKGLSGIIDNYDNRHKIRISEELNHPMNKGKKIIKVNTQLLSNLLDRHSITRIDFCTIDTEGSEYDILKTIDFDKYQINIILVENNYGDNRVNALLSNKGYKKICKISIDDVYFKESFKKEIK
jgi:FkbM family methyltransferase